MVLLLVLLTCPQACAMAPGWRALAGELAEATDRDWETKQSFAQFLAGEKRWSEKCDRLGSVAASNQRDVLAAAKSSDARERRIAQVALSCMRDGAVDVVAVATGGPSETDTGLNRMRLDLLSRASAAALEERGDLVERFLASLPDDDARVLGAFLAGRLSPARAQRVLSGYLESQDVGARRAAVVVLRSAGLWDAALGDRARRGLPAPDLEALMPAPQAPEVGREDLE